ncbi:hypothetical protein BU15DRAFT_62635 [Melanogaster broomeanus]|nr:hypothetical protein BU15DRAFT_62635 [Melanogaster broomeanus]
MVLWTPRSGYSSARDGGEGIKTVENQVYVYPQGMCCCLYPLTPYTPFQTTSPGSQMRSLASSVLTVSIQSNSTGQRRLESLDKRTIPSCPPTILFRPHSHSSFHSFPNPNTFTNAPFVIAASSATDPSYSVVWGPGTLVRSYLYFARVDRVFRFMSGRLGMPGTAATDDVQWVFVRISGGGTTKGNGCQFRGKRTGRLVVSLLDGVFWRRGFVTLSCGRLPDRPPDGMRGGHGRCRTISEAISEEQRRQKKK